MKRKIAITLTALLCVFGMYSVADAKSTPTTYQRSACYDQYYFCYDASVVQLSGSDLSASESGVNQLLANKANMAFMDVSELVNSITASRSTLYQDYQQTVQSQTDRYLSVSEQKQLKLDSKEIYNTKQGIVIDLQTGKKISFETLFDGSSDYKNVVKTEMIAAGKADGKLSADQEFYLTEDSLVLLFDTGEKNALGTTTREYTIPLQNIASVMA